MKRYYLAAALAAIVISGIWYQAMRPSHPAAPVTAQSDFSSMTRVVHVDGKDYLAAAAGLTSQGPFVIVFAESEALKKTKLSLRLNGDKFEFADATYPVGYGKIYFFDCATKAMHEGKPLVIQLSEASVDEAVKDYLAPPAPEKK